MKDPLSREAIVAEALRQLTADGIKGMSLRKVAAALETGPASLYAYVDDLDALNALVLDRALHEVDTRGSAKASWRDRLLRILESYTEVLSESPGLAQLAFGTVAIGPNALRITEALLALLAEGGVDVPTAAWAVDLLVLYVTAVVAEHSGGTHPAAPEGTVARAILGVSEGQYPRIHAARAHMLSGTPRERFGWALEVLLGGILRRRRKAKTRRSPRSRKRAG
ncbi:MAG TPA: TetR/AcrR family transcriptional regulator C-terminal domain-containing protein [Gaiellaceae bacterium]|nr:TetR/AcrR family transcriptional regulator C-terminal domain-containing protein [Gaiellaceae bacterium]